MNELMASEEQQWYVQSGSRVQGPYTTTEVGRYLLLGRVRNTDRVSRDGELWEPVTQVPELIPEELLDLDSDTGWNRFLTSRAKHDERADAAVMDIERRASAEESSVLAVREQWLRGQKQLQPTPRRSANLLPVSLLGVTLLALIVVIYLNSFAQQGL